MASGGSAAGGVSKACGGRADGVNVGLNDGTVIGVVGTGGGSADAKDGPCSCMEIGTCASMEGIGDDRTSDGSSLKPADKYDHRSQMAMRFV